MTEPKASVARILKPNLDFETLFTGTTAASPIDSGTEKIPFFEWADNKPPTNVRDPLAGKPGYDPNLLAYVAVPKGATLQLFIPYISGSGQIPAFYRYWVSFRDTSLAYMRQLIVQGQTSQSHIPYQTAGAPDSTSGTPEERFIMLAGLHSVGVHMPEPPATYLQAGVLLGNPTTGNGLSLRAEPLIPRPSLMNACLIAPGVRGVHQQGVADPASANPAEVLGSGGTWFELVAQGDQMLIAVDREYSGEEDSADPSTTPNWDFSLTGVDRSFSNVYGRYLGVNPPVPELGIYLYTVEHG